MTRLKCILITAAMILSPSSWAGVDASASADLEQKLALIRGLQAEFVQQQIALDGYLIRETAGHFLADQAGKVSWTSNAPYEQRVISNGDQLWIYDPDLEQVTIRQVSADMSDSPAMLFTGDFSKIQKTYQIAVADRHDAFVLTPIAANSAYQQINLAFNSDVPVLIEVLDSLGERTLITFSKVVLNPDIDNSIFEFVPPPGVDIIHND